jgi:hypothetical protein
LYSKHCAVFKAVAEWAMIGETAFWRESLHSWIDCQEKAVVCILATLVSAGRPGRGARAHADESPRRRFLARGVVRDQKR